MKNHTLKTLLGLLVATAALKSSVVELSPPGKLCHANQKVTIPVSKRINLFIGTGLWSAKHGLTVGLPVDILVMIISAELMRRKIESLSSAKSEIVLLIADHLAIEAGADAAQVQQRSEQNRVILNCVLKKLGITQCSVVLSSEIVQTTEYKQIQAGILQHPNIGLLLKNDSEHAPYAIVQTALGRYMHVHRTVAVKISWAHTPSQKVEQFDERWFDTIYTDVCGADELKFVYTKAGMASQKNNGATRVPYTHTPSKSRETDLRLLFYDPNNQMTVSLDLLRAMSKSGIAFYKDLIEGLLELKCKAIKSKKQDNNFDNISADLNTIVNLSNSAFVTVDALNNCIKALPNMVLEQIKSYL